MIIIEQGAKYLAAPPERSVFPMHQTIESLLLAHGRAILNSPGMQLEQQFIQHGSVTCFDHSLAVAYLSLWIVLRLGLRLDLRSLVRGALLHDYFLYDWHEKDESHRWHGFHHARRALDNASRDFELNCIERDIIEKHMFPLNLTPPRFAESVVVTCADKICACFEVFSILLYRPDFSRLGLASANSN